MANGRLQINSAQDLDELREFLISQNCIKIADDRVTVLKTHNGSPLSFADFFIVQQNNNVENSSRPTRLTLYPTLGDSTDYRFAELFEAYLSGNHKLILDKFKESIKKKCQHEHDKQYVEYKETLIVDEFYRVYFSTRREELERIIRENEQKLSDDGQNKPNLESQLKQLQDQIAQDLTKPEVRLYRDLKKEWDGISKKAEDFLTGFTKLKDDLIQRVKKREALGIGLALGALAVLAIACTATVIAATTYLAATGPIQLAIIGAFAVVTAVVTLGLYFGAKRSGNKFLEAAQTFEAKEKQARKLCSDIDTLGWRAKFIPAVLNKLKEFRDGLTNSNNPSPQTKTATPLTHQNVAAASAPSMSLGKVSDHTFMSSPRKNGESPQVESDKSIENPSSKPGKIS